MPYEITPQIKGTILGVRRVQDRGRIQIPKEVRNELHLSDGDHVYWVRSLDGKIHILKAVEIP